ncbi:acyl-CoA dehydrogenase family protein [Marinobacter sp. LN3S78]|uniref:acyl-CoA dehydrogenase family protein n=1 Tax=Marinobacter sp. LN3S78 TaxID=3382300 RepID=UPI00387B97EC
MDLNYSEEQQMLRESVERFVRRHYAFPDRQKRLAEGRGCSRELWQQMAELGWLTISLPEEDGGIGGSVADTAIVMEGLGQALALEPYLPTVLASALIARVGTDEQKARYLTPLAEGQLQMAVAFTEPQARYQLDDCATRLEVQDDGMVLEGGKSLVMGGQHADMTVVVARSGGDQKSPDGLSLVLVDRELPGIERRDYQTNDGLGAVDMHFNGVRLPASALLGVRGEALPEIEYMLDLAIACVASEAVGAVSALCQATLEYLRNRRQFGKPLGANQALQHRMVDMFIAQEETRSIALYGAMMMEEPDPVARKRALSLTKVEIARTARHVAQEAVQLHGAMGVTDELSVGHYFKRLTAINATFGDSDWHLHRIAQCDHQK